MNLAALPTFNPAAELQALRDEKAMTYNEALEFLTDAEIEAGAKALRNHQMMGRINIEWDKLTSARKKVWLHAAAAVLASVKAFGPAASE